MRYLRGKAKANCLITRQGRHFWASRSFRGQSCTLFARKGEAKPFNHSARGAIVGPPEASEGHPARYLRRKEKVNGLITRQGAPFWGLQRPPGASERGDPTESPKLQFSYEGFNKRPQSRNRRPEIWIWAPGSFRGPPEASEGHPIRYLRGRTRVNGFIPRQGRHCWASRSFRGPSRTLFAKERKSKRFNHSARGARHFGHPETT